MQNKFLKCYNALIVGLLAILGFTVSCDNDSGSDSKVEYGTPSAKFIINGKVRSSETNSVIKNIRVTIPGDTVYTDDEGNYQITEDAFPEDQTYSIKFQDIDSVLNGKFQDIDTTIEFIDPKFTGGDGLWYSGKTSKDLNVNMTPEK